MEGTAITVTGSASDPAGVLDTLSYAWTVLKDSADFASGSGATFAFTPDDNASYEIGLTVSDEDGGSTTVAQTISVANVAPSPTIVSISEPRVEGTAITVAGSASDPAGTRDTLSFVWTILKGGVDFATGSGETFAFTPDDNESYGISLTVSDEDGGSTSVSQTISVANVAPSPTIVSISTPRVEGTAITVTGTASDPAGALDTLSYVWTILKGGVDFATGSGATFAFTPDDNASYEIGLTVSDEDGGSTSVSQTISVANVAPSPTILPISEPLVEGTAITVTGTASDPAGALDTLSYVWTILKGGVDFATGSGATFAFTPDDNESYGISLTVSDENGGSTTVWETISVLNVAPSPRFSISANRGWKARRSRSLARPAIRPAHSTRSATSGPSSRAASILPAAAARPSPSPRMTTRATELA